MQARSLVFAGGGSKGKLWSQILSDVTGLTVRVPVVRALNTVNTALGFEAGLVIVVVAIVLDRVFRRG